MEQPFFLFYEEPDPDRWIRHDRIIRKFIRRVLRGPHRPGGVMRWFLNLQAGLDALNIEYRLNDYKGLRKHQNAWAHVVGKPHVIGQIPEGHPIIYGPGVSAHPLDDMFWNRSDLRLILLSCDWFKVMYDRDLPRSIDTAVWPAGVDSSIWSPPINPPDRNAILVYDKIRWNRDQLEPALVTPIIAQLREQGHVVHHITYGSYKEEDYAHLLKQVGMMVFLCEHETQGFAYLQALASGVPLLAWDRGGEWRDPAHYPHNVRFGPVTSVPYWDHRCGLKFEAVEEFKSQFENYRANLDQYRPREFVQQRFGLKDCAQQYLDLTSAFIAENP